MTVAGVKWVRIFPEWNTIQPSAGAWSWTLMDSMLNAAAANRLNVSGLFLYNASWINSNTHTFPTNNYGAWSNYVFRVVQHAAGRVRYWEVWNEPESFALGGTPTDYAQVVTNAYAAAKAADPAVQIGLSVSSVDILYLEQTIQAGAADHFDYICVHPYEVLGTLASGQEALYLSIVPTIRKMLSAKNPAKWKAPIWFTEIGEALGGQVSASSQAQDLVRAYTMAIAQGVSHVEWFEAQEGGYSMGLLDSSGNPTPAYTALKNLATQLGPNPVYRGRVLLNNRDYGFVFQGATNSVMAAWAPVNSTDNFDFGQSVGILNPVNGTLTQAATCILSNAPILVIGLPSNIVAQAVANQDQPVPWGGNYSGVSAVSASMGSPNIERGLHQLYPDSSSTAVTAYGGPARDCSKGSAQTFTLDPSFLSYTHASIRISAVVRKISATNNPGFNLKYESATGRKGIGWNSVPGSDQWYTLSWTITDDEFVGNWGYHFSFDSDSTTYSKYYLRQVTVTNLVPRVASAPTGLMAAPQVGQVSLSWNGVSGATGYTLKRAAMSLGPYEVIAPTLSVTSWLDAGLAAGTAYFYVVSALNSGGAGADSSEVGAAPLLPALSLMLTGGNVRCSWPTSATAFALQEAVALLGHWTNSSAVVLVHGSDNTVVTPTEAPARFYRLAQ